MLDKIFKSFIFITVCALSLSAKEYHVAFYSDFEPISYSINRDESHADFNIPMGYEVDLIKAIEAIKESEMTFTFQGVKEWNQIWLKPYSDPTIDIAIGGITKENRRLVNEVNEQVLANTHSTVNFCQSLLMKSEDAAKIKTHDDLTDDYIVGAVRGTTGEYRYLAKSHIIDDLDNGLLREGFIVVLEDGTSLISDGLLNIYSPEVSARSLLLPPDASSPITAYYIAEDSMIPALNEGKIQAIARGYIGNQLVAERSSGEFAVTAIYSLEYPKNRKEGSVFFTRIEDEVLLNSLNRYIDYLTDKGNLGYDDWKANKNIFMEKANILNGR